jgi:hypothetical protein
LVIGKREQDLLDLRLRFDIGRRPIEDWADGSMKDSPISRLRAGAARLRRGGLWLIFALVLMIPKLNRLRRHRRAWNFGRLIAGLAGAAMLAFGVARGHALTPLVAGALMLLFVVLLNPARPEFSPAFSIDARARELGALIAVDGGRYIDAAGSRPRAKLFLGPDRLWVLDAALHVLVEIPLQQVRTVSVEPAGTDWSFRVDWEQATAEFIYHGSFAEHLARVADATVRSLLYRELPVLR